MPKKETKKNSKKYNSEDEQDMPQIDDIVAEVKCERCHKYVLSNKIMQVCFICQAIMEHSNKLTNVLATTEMEIERLKTENKTLKEQLKKMESIDLLKLLTENEQLKNNQK